MTDEKMIEVLNKSFNRGRNPSVQLLGGQIVSLDRDALSMRMSFGALLLAALLLLAAAGLAAEQCMCWPYAHCPGRSHSERSLSLHRGHEAAGQRQRSGNGRLHLRDDGRCRRAACGRAVAAHTDRLVSTRITHPL